MTFNSFFFFFFFFFFSEETSIDISCAKQMIHMKCQDLFSLKNKKKKLSYAAVVIGALRVKTAIKIVVDKILFYYYY